MILGDTTTDLLVFGPIILFLLYKYFSRNHDYWKKRGIPGPTPLPFFGNTYEQFLKPFGNIQLERYRKYGKIYGYFEGSTPILSVADPELIKLITVKDFHAFVNRRNSPSKDFLSTKNLLGLKDEKWKSVRSIMSPAFTSGKIRKMLHMIEECSKGVLINMDKAVDSNEDLDLKKLFGAYTMDVIASCAFATKTEAHTNPNDPFLVNVYKIFNPGARALLFALPAFVRRILRITGAPKESLDFFKNVGFHLLKERRQQTDHNQNVKRNDFLQLLIDAEKSKESISGDVADISGAHFSNENKEDLEKTAKDLATSKSSQTKLTDEEAVANIFVFFAAGYETTATLLSYATYSLALNPDKQEKLYQELKKVFVDGGQEMTYESINHLDYLNAVISETLRLYSPAPAIGRQVGETYTLGDTGITLPKDSLVTMPVYGLHLDPEYFPEPDKFLPERFTKENLDQIKPYTYLPFGAGPRICIGMRFALAEAKLMLCKIILKYRFVPNKSTKIPIEYARFTVLLAAKSVVVGAEKR